MPFPRPRASAGFVPKGEGEHLRGQRQDIDGKVVAPGGGQAAPAGRVEHGPCITKEAWRAVHVTGCCDTLRIKRNTDLPPQQWCALEDCYDPAAVTISRTFSRTVYPAVKNCGAVGKNTRPSLLPSTWPCVT